MFSPLPAAEIAVCVAPVMRPWPTVELLPLLLRLDEPAAVTLPWCPHTAAPQKGSVLAAAESAPVSAESAQVAAEMLQPLQDMLQSLQNVLQPLLLLLLALTLSQAADVRPHAHSLSNSSLYYYYYVLNGC